MVMLGSVVAFFNEIIFLMLSLLEIIRIHLGVLSCGRKHALFVVGMVIFITPA
ncbi:hypothetical protein RYX36_021198, partial [Vicia faba]